MTAQAYRIVIPASAYDVLTAPTAFADGTPQDEMACKILRYVAVPKIDNGIIRYHIAAGKTALLYILAHIPGPVGDQEPQPVKRRQPARKAWTQVPHSQTGEIVGWLRKGEFRPVELGPPEN